MFLTNNRRVVAMVLLGAAAVALMATNTQAQGPTIRTFGYYATGSTVGPDFTSDNSKVVTALPNLASPDTGQTIEFADSDVNPEWLRGSLWVVVPAHHAVKANNAPAGVFLWRVDELTPDLPPVGANTVTGPNGMIIDQTSVRIRPCEGGTDCGFGVGSDKWRVTAAAGDGAAFVIVTAVFSR